MDPEEQHPGSQSVKGMAWVWGGSARLICDAGADFDGAILKCTSRSSGTEKLGQHLLRQRWSTGLVKYVSCCSSYCIATIITNWRGT